ncbi:hypothetical protein ACFFQW_43785 [Umezawaea endophytica]|uniref:Uncharacterized protein n=1 Tax=Umezawaea endophytica TaxID=1654476 RepID=A0A9X2VVF1_9PSEU|nr:hypothetical protein [Umezawaea endophytica]MCS7483102.1 hypothetical protein [Umezawaea endophytica]
MTDTSAETWPPEDLRNTVAFVMVQARHRIYLADDETGESGWRCEWGRTTERISPAMAPILAELMRRGAFTLGHRHTIGGYDSEPAYAYELEITPFGHVLHDRVTYGHGLE